jgi:GrpB-like predicted nucleotidyltransferase (UPF0157 family)
MTEPIHIVDYNPDWPRRFAAEAEIVCAALGPLCLRLEHVGSTAVPGLAAKPIIDMAVECAVYPPDAAVIAALAAAGYGHRGEFGVAGRHFFSKGEPRAFHLHLVPAQGEVARRQVAFRDFLRSNPAAAREYSAIKRLAAEGRVLESSDYVQAKAPFVEAALAQWAGLLDGL